MNETKKYRILNNFHDIHDKDLWHKPTDKPIDLTIDRVAEINMVEHQIGYKLIEEIKNFNEKENKNKKTKK